MPKTIGKTNHQKNDLDPNQILIAEYNYAAQTAFQATEDRVKVFNYVLASIGTFLGTFFIPSLTTIFNPLVFSILFFVLGVFGLMSLFKLAKLRTSWISSVKAMLQIKEYYIQNTKVNLEEAFRWKSSTLPKADKVWSVAFLMALTTMLLNSLTISGSLYLFVSYTQNINFTFESVVFGIIVLILQLWFWFKATGV